jgi:predicted AAA+ superfamily ATPase
MSLKPWREIAVPHEDVLKGTFQQAEFAADLSLVHSGKASPEYQNPALFFQRTFITEGMRFLLDSVIKRLNGMGGDPVIQLQTAFGGGKTHTMLAVYHLAKGGMPTQSLQGISDILGQTKTNGVPKSNIAVLDGVKQSPSQSKKRGSITVNTLWGELAWQLGQEKGYEYVREADISGTSPGKETLSELLSHFSPCVILIDELVAYIRQFEEGKKYTGGTYDSNISFVQALTEALKLVPNAVLLASLPESDKEAGSQRGVSTLRTLEHYFARVQAIWKPVATEEAFEIVRRRLFSKITDKDLAHNICRNFSDFYASHGDDFPKETQDSRYYERLVHAYPIHPEVFDRLYEDWSSLEGFQRTRGVLKLMAKVIHRLWKDDNKDPLIMPGNIPLYDIDVRNEAIYYLPQGWDPVIEKDIDGERAETTEIENNDTLLGSVQACRRVARTIFLGSAPTSMVQIVRGLEQERIILGCTLPEQPIARYKDALKRLSDKLHYLNGTNNRFWFDTKPNLRREMEERKRRFQDKEDVIPVIRDLIQGAIGTSYFSSIHVFTPHKDIPDDEMLKLVVLPPDAAYSRSVQTWVVDRVTDILKNRGEQPRQKQNRLIFLVADYESVSRLKDQVRAMLAWKSIVNDYKEDKIVIDNLMANTANASLSQAQDSLKRMIRETYKWILTPAQEARNGKVSELQWEDFQLNPGTQNFSQEINKILSENELLISEWSPIHLSNMLKTWFWKNEINETSAKDVWQKSCCYLYLPRLKDEQVLKSSISAGAASKDFFGVAYGKEDSRYIGFSFAKSVPQIFDDSLLLIEPTIAAIFEDRELVKVGDKIQLDSSLEVDQNSTTLTKSGGSSIEDCIISRSKKQQFYGNVIVDPIKAKYAFSEIVDEVLMQFTENPEVKVKISVEITAQAPDSFDEATQRSIKENCNVLKFKNAEFE